MSLGYNLGSPVSGADYDWVLASSDTKILLNPVEQSASEDDFLAGQIDASLTMKTYHPDSPLSNLLMLGNQG